MRVKGGTQSNIIDRNTPIPCKQMKTYYTTEDNQTSMDIPVYEGERPMVVDNNFLGKFNL